MAEPAWGTVPNYTWYGSPKSREREATMWGRGLFEQFGRPQLEREKSWLTSQEPYYQTLASLRSQMVGAPGIPGGQATPRTNMPWWLSVPGTSGPAWDELTTQLSGLSRLNLEEAGQRESGNLATLAAARGLPISGDRARLLPGFQRFYETERAKESGELALLLESIASGRRAEATGAFGTLEGALSGWPPSGDAMGWGGQAFGLADRYAQERQQKAQQRAAAWGSMLNALGMYLGMRSAKPPAGEVK